MIGRQQGLAFGERFAEQGFGLGKSIPFLQQRGQVIGGLRHIEVLGTPVFLPHLIGLAQEVFGFFVAALLSAQPAKAVQCLGDLRMVAPIGGDRVAHLQ